MVEERPGRFNSTPRHTISALTASLILGLAIGCRPSLAGEVVSIRLSEAAEQGTFNVGAAHVAVAHVPDLAGDGEILKLDYAIAPGAAAGLYAKNLPGRLDPLRTDVVRVGLKANSPDEARQVSTALELKGTAGVQRVPLEMHPGWVFTEVTLNWPEIGVLQEVVVSMTRTEGGGPAQGVLLIDVRFEELPFLRRLALSWWVRAGGVLLTSLAVWLVVGLLRWPQPPARKSRGRRGSGCRPAVAAGGNPLATIVPARSCSWCGVRAHRPAGSRGESSGFEWTFGGWLDSLAVACAGAAWRSCGSMDLPAGISSTPEVFQDMLVSGLLATSSSSLAILQRRRHGLSYSC